jgi:hypothetical protein
VCEKEREIAETENGVSIGERDRVWGRESLMSGRERKYVCVRESQQNMEWCKYKLREILCERGREMGVCVCVIEREREREMLSTPLIFPPSRRPSFCFVGQS